MTIGERIKNRREELGLTQQELAERLGNKSRASVSTVENDKEDMTTTRVRQYADALQTTTSYLMGWDEIPVLDPPEKKLIPQLKKHYPPEEIEKAMMLYEKYKDSIPEIQQAVESLLKSHQSDS